MAKAVMAVYGIDQIDQVVREAARRGNRSGFGQPSSCNSPRAAPEVCHDPSPWRSASRLHSTGACGDDSERRGGSSRVPRPVRAAARSSAGGRGAADSAAAQPAARLLLEIYRAYFLPGASLGWSGAVRLEQACSTPGGGGGGGWRSTPAFSSPQQQGCHPPPAPRRRSASRPDPRS